jgi:uncharacterized membrane protein
MAEFRAGKPGTPELPSSVSSPLPERYEPIDALRGLIMMLMAMDHACAYFAREHSVEFWSGAMSAYNTAFPFVVRWITHLCAPGFFFLMGAAIYWSYASRSDTIAQQKFAVHRTAWRGIILILLGQFVEQPLLSLQSVLTPSSSPLSQISAPIPNDGGIPYWTLLVLPGLGMVMFACAFILRWKPWTWLVVAALSVIATNSLMPSDGQAAPAWLSLLLVPGLSSHLLVLYPLIPWLAATAAGMYFGYWWRAHTRPVRRRIWILGLLMLLVGIAIREAGGWGNIRLPRDESWIEFFNNVKYPPSLVFLLITLGTNLVVLGILKYLPPFVKSPGSPWIVFGQTPLFFYIVHFAVLTVLAFLFFKEAASLQIALLTWPVVLLILYPLCVSYRRFKLSKPNESLWRIL